jgi:Choline/Carnitine o-acyltransferase
MGTVVSDGFGLGYIIKDNALSYSVSSKHRQTQRYVNMLRTTLSDFQQILKPTSTMEVSGDRVQANRPASLKDIKIPQSLVNSYDDFYGESSHNESANKSSTKLDRLDDESATSYFSLVKRKASIRGNLLSRIGLNVKLSHENSKGSSD